MKTKIFLIIIILLIYICTSYQSSNCADSQEPSLLPPYNDLPVPANWQYYPMWCGHACVEMWAWYEGKYWVTQEVIANNLNFCDFPDPFTGMHFYQIARAVNVCVTSAVGDFGLDFSNFGRDMILSVVIESLRGGEPSILTTKTLAWENHAIIVKGYTKLENSELFPFVYEIAYNDPDPLIGGPQKLNYYEFNEKWWPIRQYFSESDRFIGIETYAYFYVTGLGNRSYSEILENAAQGYLGFLKRCGTYYGGPTIYIPEGSTFLRVRSPQGNETLAARKSDQIIWESNGLSGKIRLELYKNDSFLGTLATNLPIENGSHTWTVGDYINGSAQTGDDYRIKVSMMDDSYDDFSNVNFSIGDINVTIPNGGETWEQGSMRTITWNNSYFAGNVQLILVKTIPGTDYLIADNIENTGSYEWQVGMCSHIEEPEAPFGMTLPGDNYKIKVVSVDNPDLQDSGDQLFSIVEPQPGITVVSPNGGENWQAGSIDNITWTASGLSENVKITLWQNGAVAGTIATPVDPALGTYSWTVGQYVSGTAQVGNGYTIKIKEIGTAAADFSDASF
ncbi:MAG: hypothetical protein KAW12_21590, partial [Candidatus Aminicenantes bacterium]|nr:hypothetical protein [Candidatus Aminicenantes bacterium]